MILDNLKNIIKGTFSKPDQQPDQPEQPDKPDKKEWFGKLVENLEDQSLKNETLPFKIIALKSTGFAVKVSGLYAFISFKHMPWENNNVDYWTSIAPKLIDKVFYCNVYSIKKDPSLSIIVNGEVHQFKKTELRVGRKYKGIIIKKVKSGVLVEIGHHFNWRCGSFVGFLHISQFNSAELYASCSAGDEIEILYQGLNEKGQLVYTQTGEVFEWINGIPQSLVGQIVLVHVVRKNVENGAKFLVKLLVNGKYKGKMMIEKKDPIFGSKKKAKQAKNNLKDGDIIHCEVIGFVDKKQTLMLKWITELDSEIIDNGFVAHHLPKDESAQSESTANEQDIPEQSTVRNSIMDNLDNDTIQKMITIRDKIELPENTSDNSCTQSTDNENAVE